MQVLEKLQKIQFKHNPHAISWLENPTNEDILLFLDNNPRQYREIPVEKLTDEIVDIILKHNYNILFTGMFPELSEKTYIDIINSNADNFKWITNPSNNVQKAFILRKRKYDRSDISKFSQENIELGIKKDKIYASDISPSKYFSEKFTNFMVRKSYYFFSKLEKPTKKQMFIAIKHHSEAYSKIKNPTLDQTRLAIKYHCDVFPKNFTPELITLYIKHHPDRFYYIVDYYMESLTDDHKKLAIELCPANIQNIKDASKELRIFALEKDANNIRYIKNPTEEEIDLAIKSYNLEKYPHNLTKYLSKKQKALCLKKWPEAIKDFNYRDVTFALKKIAINKKPELILELHCTADKKLGILALQKNPSLACNARVKFHPDAYFEAIKSSGYDIDVISQIDLRVLSEEQLQMIDDNLIIKDIIE